jgi:hypothetical protein
MPVNTAHKVGRFIQVVTTFPLAALVAVMISAEAHIMYGWPLYVAIPIGVGLFVIMAAILIWLYFVLPSSKQK